MKELPKKIEDIRGKEYGKLTVIEFSHIDNNKGSYWLCRCVCGKEKVLSRSHFVSGHTTSCGCQAKLNRAKRATMYFGKFKETAGES